MNAEGVNGPLQPLVGRLRWFAKWSEGFDPARLCADAADEIERLNKAVEDLTADSNTVEINGECGIGFEIVHDDRLRVGMRLAILTPNAKTQRRA